MATEPSGPGSGLSTHDDRRVRRAVLTGIGEARNHPDRGDPATDATTLATAAVERALEESGGASIRESVGLVAMPVGSDDAPDPAGALRDALDLPRARTMVAAIGVSQQRLVSNAVLAVETGAADAVLVVGSEAKASALHSRRSGAVPRAPRTGPGADDVLEPVGEFMADAEVAAMLWDPVVQYALIDSALARREGRSPAELRSEVSHLWARFDAVAAGNPEACFTGPPHTADDLATTTDGNRLLAFPYNKWHSTQWALDHAAALLICAEDTAGAHGVPEEQLLHPLVALDTSWGLTLARRADPHRWPTMRVMGEFAAEHLGQPVDDIGLAEVYSCFPAAVRVQQRELGLPLDGTPTLLGGMPFAGGPFNHFTYMATAEVARRLRRGDAGRGLVTTVSGLLTKGGLMVWGREPHPRGALVADVADEARAATATVDLAPFAAERTIRSDDRVVAATVTAGFDPRTFSLVDDAGDIRHVVAAPPPDGDPVDGIPAVPGDR